MMELFILGIILFVIFTLFYKQAIHEFRINQIDWEKRDRLSSLLQEKIPLVIRGIPSTTCWSHNDVLARDCYSQLPIFKEFTLKEWICSPESATALCPWKDLQAEQIASRSGISIWAERWLHSAIVPSFLSSWWILPRSYCWTGKKGLHKTFGVPTCIFPVQGEILVSVLPQHMKNHLPMQWLDRMPHEITMKDTPFFADLKYIDILLRPGTCLLMPPHWFISWTPVESAPSSPPMVCSIVYHNPMSRLAYHTSTEV